MKAKYIKYQVNPSVHFEFDIYLTECYLATERRSCTVCPLVVIPGKDG